MNDKKTFKGGFGIAQWGCKTRVKALQVYVNNYANGVVVSEKAQFGYLVKELSGNLSPSSLNSKSLEEVTWIILRSFENPFSVRCTESSPCKSYSFTYEAGYPCRYTGATNSSGKKQIAYWNSVNTHNAKTSYSDVVNNKKAIGQLGFHLIDESAMLNKLKISARQATLTDSVMIAETRRHPVETPIRTIRVPLVLVQSAPALLMDSTVKTNTVAPFGAVTIVQY